jgi:sugar phosphate isomerase/epimerase
MEGMMKPILTGFLDLNGKTTFNEQISRALKHGIEYIALRTYQGQRLIELSDSEIKTMLQELKNAKLKVSVIDSGIEPYDLYDDKKHKDALDEFKYMLKFADKFKAAYLYLMLPKFNDVIEEIEPIIKRLEDFIDAAMRQSKKIILQPSAPYKTNVYAYIFKKIKSKDISYAFDPVHLVTHDESTTTAYRLLRHKIGIISAIDSDHQGVPKLLGYGKTDVISIFKKLLRDRFDGFISIDNHFYENVFHEVPVKQGFFQKLFSNEKKKKEDQMSDLSKKIFPNEETKNVTYDDILDNQIKVVKIIFK